MELFKLFGTIACKNDEANAAIDETTGKAESSSDKMESAFKKVGGIVAAVFTVDKIKEFGKACVDAYAVREQAELKLGTVMKQRMGADDGMIQSVKKLAAEQQNLGVVADEVQFSGAQQLSTFLDTDGALKTLIPAMNNLAVQQNGVNVTSEGMVNIGNLMGKVMQGQTSALTRVGITFTDAQEKVLKYGNEQERAAMLAQVITDNVGNMNEAFAQTDSGKIQQAKNNFGAMEQTIGAKLLPIVAKFYGLVNKFALFVTNSVIPALEHTSKWLKKHEAMVKAVAVVFGILTAAIVLQNAVQAIKAAMNAAETTSLTALIGAKLADAAATMVALAPYILIVAAIAAVIAIGVLLYKNWDKVKEKAVELWNSIKETFEGIKNAISEKINAAKEVVGNVLGNIKDKFSSAFNAVKNIVKSAIDKIKSFFKFKWSLPKIKLPHFAIKGGFSLNPPKIPHFNVDWYKKAMDNPMVMTKPTIFGVNPATGRPMGGGEAGSEVVSGTSTLMSMIRAVVKGENSKIVETLKSLFDDIAFLASVTVNLDGKPIANELADGVIKKISRSQLKLQKAGGM